MKFIGKKYHFLLMAAGCVAMLGAVFVLTTTTRDSSWGIYLLLLFCPAMHLFMHRGMHGRGNRRNMPHAQLPTLGKELPAEKHSRSQEYKH
jgi:hypothetical protein